MAALEPESRAASIQGFADEARRGDENPYRAFDEVFADGVGESLLEISFVDNASGKLLRENRSPNEFVRIDSDSHALFQSPKARFNIIVCWWALEFTPEPWNLARRIESLLAPEGRIFISVPWIWDEQSEFDDYYRFAPPALHSMFENITWDRIIRHSTTVPGEIMIGKKAGIENQFAMILRHPDGTVRKYLPFIRIQMSGRKNTAS